MILVVAGALLLAGCPPPPLQLDQPDGGGNVAPNIRSVLDGAGEEFATGIDATTILVSSSEFMTVTIEDLDVEDTIFVHAFLDYDLEGNDNVSPVSECEAGPTTPRSTTRTARCTLSAVCADGDVGAERHVFEVWVADRQPADASVSPPNRSVLGTGEYDEKAFGVICGPEET